MSGYVEAGYLVVIVGLGSYAASLVARERAARARLSPRPRRRSEPDRPTRETR